PTPLSWRQCTQTIWRQCSCAQPAKVMCPGVNPANPPIIALVTGRDGALPVWINLYVTGKDFLAHACQICLDGIEQRVELLGIERLGAILVNRAVFCAPIIDHIA